MKTSLTYLKIVAFAIIAITYFSQGAHAEIPISPHNGASAVGILIQNPIFAEKLWKGFEPYAQSQNWIHNGLIPHFTIGNAISCEHHRAENDKNWVLCFFSKDRREEEFSSTH